MAGEIVPYGERWEDDPRRKQKKTYTPDPHRLLPQSPDAEKATIGSILNFPRESVGLCVERGVMPEWFFIPAHAIHYKILAEMWDRNEPIDIITFTEYLRDYGLLDQAGGASYVTELFTFMPTAANLRYYIEILEEKWMLRCMIVVCTTIASRCYDEQDEVPLLMDAAETEVVSIRAKKMAGVTLTIKSAVVRAIGHIEEVYSRRGGLMGTSFGYPSIDLATSGAMPGQMIVIAARPSQGKTALAMNMAEKMILAGKRVGVFSLEMSTEELVGRMLCSMARVNLVRVREGFLSERDFPALQTSASKLAESKMWFDDTSGLTIQQLRAKARMWKLQHGIDCIVVDYLQLLKSSSKRAQKSKYDEVSECSEGLKSLCRELGIFAIVCAQLGRDFEKRASVDSYRPRLSDLKDSGSIEQDADVIFFIVRPEMYAENDEEKKALIGQAELILAKQRNGPLQDFPMTFLKEYTRFEERAEEDVNHQAALDI